jgi:hypothetical protein
VNDLEERLRADMWEAAGPIEPDLDLDAVVRDGDQVLRSRRIRLAVGGIAAVVALAMLSWVAVANRVLSGVPDPAQTVSASPAPTPTDVVGDPMVASFGLIDQYEPRTPSAAPVTPDTPTQVDVRVVDDHTVQFVGTTVGGTVTTRMVAMPAKGVVTEEILPGVLAGFLPTRADWLDVWLSQKPSLGWVSTDTVGRKGEYVAFVRAFPRDAGDVGRVTGYVWGDSKGRVHDSEGRPVLSRTVRLAKAEGVFYADPGGRGFAFHTAQLIEVDGYLQGEGAVAFEGASAGDGTRYYRNEAVGALPVGATKVTFQWKGTASSRDVTVFTLGGRKYFVATSRQERAAGGAVLDGGLASISYVGADGSQVTYRPAG